MNNKYRDILNDCRNAFVNLRTTSEEQREKDIADLDAVVENLAKEVQRFTKTGHFDVNAERFGLARLSNISEQENLEPAKTRTRNKKKGTLVEKTEDNVPQIKIKQEKISGSFEPNAAIDSTSSTTSSVVELIQNVKVEKDEMPAPLWIPPKKKQKEPKIERPSRSTRTKGKKAATTDTTDAERDSDVVVQNSTITTITLSDDTEESEPEKPKVNESTSKTRSTSTKTRKAQPQAQVQSDSGTETDTESIKSEKTKALRSRKEEQTTENSDCEEKSTRSTRTKTRKGKKVEEDKEESKESQQEVRTTRTKTRKGVKKPEENVETQMDNALNETTTRSTRTKTRKNLDKNKEEASNDKKEPEEAPKKIPDKIDAQQKGQSKRNRSISTDEETIQTNDRKKSKSNSPKVDNEANNITTQTEYEDARSTLGQPQENQNPQQLNATYVTTKPSAAPVETEPPLNATITVKAAPTPTNLANTTVVVDKPINFNIFNKNDQNPLFTDDDSIEQPKTPPKVVPKPKSGKEVFSPYEKTTLKKKVEAFEKLQNGSEIPIKFNSSVSKKHINTPQSVKEKAKYFTPLGSRFMPSSSSTSKVNRTLATGSSNDSLLAMKSAQKESREKQKKMLEREQALKKKEAMLQAQAEAKRKLNEEKQLKAQQQRKVLEAEKQKQLELQKQKEERLKQRELEREEYLQKQKLELEKKRLAQKKKIQEMQAQRLQILEEQNKNPPVYMTTKLPRLPTEDCYDSDDLEYKKVTPPSWCSGDQSRIMQLTMLASGEKIKNTLFCRHAQTPDLIEIFETIDPRKLKRSSSVLWRKPPRYTMMPDLNETRFSEDDELYESD